MEVVVILSASDKETLGRILFETVCPSRNWLDVLPMERRQWVNGAVTLYTIDLDQIRHGRY